MGRIQKKKTSGVKKKKKLSIAKTSPEPAKGAKTNAVNKVVPSQDPAKIRKKKQAPPQKKQLVTSSPAAVKPKDNILTKSIQFLREVKVELKKVTWPSRKQTIGSTVVVIALVMLISLFLGVVDMGLSSLIRIVLR